MKTDVLIIGSGVAAMHCAANAAKCCDVMIIPGGNLKIPEQSGFVPPSEKYKDKQEFLSETLNVGCNINYIKLAEIMCEEGFGLTKSHLSVKNLTCPVYDNFRAMRIKIEGGKACGVYCFDTRNKKWFCISASCVVLATGGFEGIFSSCADASSFGCDSIAMAYHAGAYLRDMEFIRFGKDNSVYTLGGIEINEKCETRIPGIFACGAVAGGVHGGDCIEDNIITDEIVFGKIAGKSVAGYVKESKKVKNDLFEAEDLPAPFDAMEYMRIIGEASLKGLTCPRNSLTLDDSFKTVTDIADESARCPESFDSMRVHNKAVTASIALWAASTRLGSFGCHIRSDERQEKSVMYNRYCYEYYGKLGTERKGNFQLPFSQI